MRADWPPYIWGEVGINPGARGDEDPRYATAEIGRPLRSAETAFHRVGLQGLRLSIALKYLVEPDIESKRKGASLVDGDVAAEIETRPSPRNLSRLLLPKKDFANSFSKELAEAQGAAPPPPPLVCTHSVGLPVEGWQNLPRSTLWRRKGSSRSILPDSSTSQRGPNGAPPPQDQNGRGARGLAGQVRGIRGGSSVYSPATSKIASRRMWPRIGEAFLLAHMARSRAKTDEVR